MKYDLPMCHSAFSNVVLVNTMGALRGFRASAESEAAVCPCLEAS